MIQDQNLMTGKMMKFVTARKAPPKGLMAKGRIDVNLCERLVEECPVPEWQLRRMRNLEKRRSLYRPDRVEDRKTRASIAACLPGGVVRGRQEADQIFEGSISAISILAK